MRHFLLSVILTVFGLASCTDMTAPALDPPEPAGSPLRTDRLEYSLTRVPGGFGANLVVTYTNQGSRTVYLPGCALEQPVSPMYGFVRAVPDTGRVISSIAWTCVGGVPALAIPPGAGRTDTIRFLSLESPHAQPPEHPHERVGLMRVVYDIHGSIDANGEADYRDRLPESDRRSNVFKITY